MKQRWYSITSWWALAFSKDYRASDLTCVHQLRPPTKSPCVSHHDRLYCWHCNGSGEL